MSPLETRNPRADSAARGWAGNPSLSTFAGVPAAVIALARRKAVREASERAYRHVVEQAREPGFFAECGVPDTLDGRFELVCLHAFLYLYRLKAERPEATALAQAFFDTMFGDLDGVLREIGIGDLRVGREVKRMARGFYGRIRAYEHGIAADDSALRAALSRNLFGTAAASAAQLAAMAAYVRRAADDLRRQEAADLLAGRVRFVSPPVAAPASAAVCR